MRIGFLGLRLDFHLLLAEVSGLSLVHTAEYPFDFCILEYLADACRERSCPDSAQYQVLFLSTSSIYVRNY